MNTPVQHSSKPRSAQSPVSPKQAQPGTAPVRDESLQQVAQLGYN